PIPFKSQLHSHHGGFAIYMAEFASGKTERFSIEETDLLEREVKVRKQTIYEKSRIPPKHFCLYAHNNNLLHCNPFIFNIWHVCVLLRPPVCVISRKSQLTQNSNEVHSHVLRSRGGTKYRNGDISSSFSERKENRITHF
ncbi:MAG: hypothetical protein ACRCZO_06585, partial [Cetobacterium sp.]